MTWDFFWLGMFIGFVLGSFSMAARMSNEEKKEKKRREADENERKSE